VGSSLLEWAQNPAQIWGCEWGPGSGNGESGLGWDSWTALNWTIRDCTELNYMGLHCTELNWTWMGWITIPCCHCLHQQVPLIWRCSCSKRNRAKRGQSRHSLLSDSPFRQCLIESNLGQWESRVEKNFALKFGGQQLSAFSLLSTYCYMYMETTNPKATNKTI
jgi:hypothetical protein